MQGAGNDYIYINGFEEPVPQNPEKLAVEISDRHFGVGADGLVLILPSEDADAQMRMFNADGSESEMCGNAIRCVAKFLYDHGISPKETLTISTGDGIKTLQLFLENGKANRVRVDMGQPVLNPKEIPTTLRSPGGEEEPIIEFPFRFEDEESLTLLKKYGKSEERNAGTREEVRITCISMGNPHCITFDLELVGPVVHQLGARMECDPRFPRRINVEFAEVISPRELRMRVWERGSGETYACGTGACAVCVAAVLSGRCERKVLLHLPGGELEIEWSESNNHLYKTGPAVEVFHGEFSW